MWQVIAILSGAFLAGGTSLGLGLLVFRRLGIRGPRDEQISLAFVVGSVCFSQIVFLLCTIGLARRGIFVAIGLVAGLSFFYEPGDAETATSSKLLPHKRQWLLRVLFTLFGIVYAVNALAPEMSPDGSAYHLPLVSRYLSAHGFQAIPTNFYASLPQAIELLFLPAVSVGGPSAASLMHLLFLVDLVLLMICYGRRFHFPVPAAFAAFLVFASPIVGWDATVAYNDVAAAAILFALFYLLQIWDYEQTACLLIPVGVLAGASYAVKYTAAIGLPYAIAYVGWKLWRTRKPLLRPLVTVCALSALIILPWMVKNAVFVGNPVAPFANELFSNRYVHVSFEKEYVSRLGHYHLTNWRQAPVELTVKGERLQGYLGPIFLIMPVGLLALRKRHPQRDHGRRLLLAGAVFALPWFFNAGTRFLIPALPPFTMVLALALAPSVALLPALAVLHAFLSWYATPLTYFDSYAPRITSFPLRAALRIEPEHTYLARLNSGYLVDRLIEQEVPYGEKVFSFDPIPEAWTTRQILTGYYSAENEVLRDTLWTAMASGQCPVHAIDLHFLEERLKGIRVVQVGESGGKMWQISEMKMFSGNTAIAPQRTRDFEASANPWDVDLAFDDSLATRWQSWQPATPGMSFGVRFSEPARIDRVRLLTTGSAYQPHIRLQGLAADGNWHNLPAHISTDSTRATEDLRISATRFLLDRGIRYLLVSPETLGAQELNENSAAWGIQPIGESKGTWLYLLTGRADLIRPIAISLTQTPGVPPGDYDDADSRVAFHAAWTHDSQFQEAYRHTVTYSNIPGASLSLAFTGNAIDYIYTRSDNRGIAEVWIDDRLRDRVDLYAPVTEWRHHTKFDVPGPGPHTIRIQVTGEHAPRSSDCFVDLDALIVE